MDFYNLSQWLAVDFSDAFWEISFQSVITMPIEKTQVHRSVLNLTLVPVAFSSF